MRQAAGFLAALLLAACGKAVAPPANSEELSFAGASSTDPAALQQHGERIVKVLGCGGCHGNDLTGQPWDDDPAVARLWSPNLTIAQADYSDAALERLLRQGKHRSRHDLWIMPSENFRYLSGPDLLAVTSYLRTLEPTGERSPPPFLGAAYRKEIAAGNLKPAARIIAENPDVRPVDAGPGYELGRYIASVTCAECHNLRLEGWADDTPDLAIAAAYSREAFHELMRTGRSLTGRDLGLMRQVARSRFSNLTDAEVDAVFDYLTVRAALPDPIGANVR